MEDNLTLALLAPSLQKHRQGHSPPFLRFILTSPTAPSPVSRTLVTSRSSPQNRTECVGLCAHESQAPNAFLRRKPEDENNRSQLGHSSTATRKPVCLQNRQGNSCRIRDDTVQIRSGTANRHSSLATTLSPKQAQTGSIYSTVRPRIRQCGRFKSRFKSRHKQVRIAQSYA